MSRDRMVLIALAAVTIVVVIAMMMKQSTPTDVSAGDGKTTTAPPAANDPGAPPKAPAVNPTAPSAAVGTTAQDRAFRDPKNRFTIRVGQYANDPAGVASAQAAYRYLLTEGGLVIAPVVSIDGQSIVLCVGAEAKTDALNVQLGWLHQLRGPTGGKKLPYTDAWVDNIDHVVRR